MPKLLITTPNLVHWVQTRAPANYKMTNVKTGRNTKGRIRLSVYPNDNLILSSIDNLTNS